MAGLFDTKPKMGSLLGLLGTPPTPPASWTLLDLGRALDPVTPPPPKPSFSDLIRALEPATRPTTPFGLLGGSGFFAPSTAPATPPPRVLPAPEIKRRTYFAFHFGDSFRVNNVRQAWKIKHPHSENNRSFVDSSLWEQRKLTNSEAIKNLIRGGVKFTSAVCVLVGAHTWYRRWVRYEIARAVIDQRGLLAVHINGLEHHERHVSDPLGADPLHFMGVYRSQNGKFYLAEQNWVVIDPVTQRGEFQWQLYPDHTDDVPLPRFLTAPDAGYVRSLATATDEYDFVGDQGHRNLGAWVDRAARRAGRI